MKALQILRKAYNKVQSLEDFVKEHVTEECYSKLLQPADRRSFISLLKTSLVCTETSVTEAKQIFSCQQSSKQTDVVLQVLQKLRKRKKRNILVLGYRDWRPDSKAPLYAGFSMECIYPNNNISRLYLPPWTTLLQRIGDDLMDHLLLTRAIYLLIDNGCYIQATGCPLYELHFGSQSPLLDQVFPRKKRKNNNKPTSSSKSRTRQHQAVELPKLPTIQEFYLRQASKDKLESVKGSNGDVCVYNEVKPDSVKRKRPADCCKNDDMSCAKKHCFAQSIQCSAGKSTVDVIKHETDHVTGYSIRSTSGVACQNQNPCRETQRSCAATTCNVKQTEQYNAHLEEMIAKDNHEMSKKILENLEDSKQISRLAVFERVYMYYSRDMVEKYPVGFVSALLKQDACAVVADVFSVALTKVVKCSCVQKKKVQLHCKNIQYDLPQRSIQQLEGHFDRVVRKMRALRKLCPVLLDQLLQHPKPKFDSSSNHIPDLSGPVFTRGQHYSLTNAEKLCDVIMGGKEKQQNQAEGRQMDNQTIAALLEQHVPLFQINQFIRIVLDKVIPHDLLGKKNIRAFYKAVEKFLHLERYEKFYVGNLTDGLVVNDVDWLTGVSVEIQMLCLAKLTTWIFTHLVIPLLKGNFFITDSTAHRNRVFYYRKKTWKLIQEKGLEDLFRDIHLEEITKDKVRNLVKSGRSLGVAHLRFMPTASSLRPIVNLGTCQPLSKTPNFSINDKLQVLHGVLTLLKKESLLGSSKFGLDDIYKTWKQFLEYRQKTGDVRPLYFSSVDIKGCYNSIKQHKLFDIIKDVLDKSLITNYVIRRYCTVLLSGGETRSEFKRHTTSVEQFEPSFVKFVEKQIRLNRLKDAIFIDQVYYDNRESSQLLQQLANHIFRAVVKVSNKYYLQKQGIIQGSMTSTILCNYYYGAMERDYLTVLEDEMLMRQVDDFLFVTPYKDNAKRFLEMMLTGIKEYNCIVNRKKSLTNININMDGMKYIPRNVYFPWCGILFDVSTLEARVDYTRYHGIVIRDCITMDQYYNPESNLMKKITSSVTMKCHGMFLDHMINSLPVLVENAFYMFLLAAYKFHCYAKHLSRDGRKSENHVLFRATVNVLPSHFMVFMKKKTISQQNSSPLTKAIIQWICYKAFVVKLQRHHSAYHKLLSWLRNQIRKLNKVVTIPAAALPSEVPEEFRGILES